MVEDRSEFRSEYYQGEIFAMTGGTLDHNRILNNISRLLSDELKGRCEVFTSDVRLLVEAHGLYTYPDIMVICGPPKLLAGRTDTVTEAQVIMEVLSPSTESYDRGLKSEFYRALGGLQQVILVSQDERRVDSLLRQGPDAWLLRDEPIREGSVEIPSLALSLLLGSIYARIDLTP